MTPQIQKEDEEGTDRLHIPSLTLNSLSKGHIYLP